MGKFIRGSISEKLEKECMDLKKDLEKRGVNPKLLTRPKLQEILLASRALNYRLSLIPMEKINKILLG